MKTDFSNGVDQSVFVYANSYRFKDDFRFETGEGCIQNKKNPHVDTGFENVSIMTREKFSTRTRVEIECSFDAWGAPLIVIAEDIQNEDIPRYGNYMEVVIYENGINVWGMKYDGQEVLWNKLMSVDYAVSPKERHTLAVDILENSLEITADGRKMSVYVENMYPSYHVGIDACENVNRFYSFEVEHTPVDKNATRFRCPVCAHIHEGDTPPETCPDCNAAADKFVRI